MPGHAGFAYGFRVQSNDVTESWFIRLPPPGVKWVGTADVLRQVCVLNALDGTDVPHCSVKWSGDDPKWFGSPYFIVPWLEGDVMRIGQMTGGISCRQSSICPSVAKPHDRSGRSAQNRYRQGAVSR